MRRIAIAFLLVICSPVCAPALTSSSHIVLLGPKGRTYYVSPKGSNANSGLDPARAWQNTAKVNEYKFNRGDRVLFEGGQTFVGNVILNSPVTPGPFTMGSYGSRKATIKSGSSSCISATNVPSLTISNINCVGSGDTSNTADGIVIRNTGAAKIAGPSISSVTVDGYGNNCILISAGAEATGANGFSGISVTHNTIENCSGKAKRNATGVQISGGSSAKPYCHSKVTVAHNIVYNAIGTAGVFSGSGLWLNCIQGLYVANNVVHDNGADNATAAGPAGILLAFVDGSTLFGCTVERNEVYNTKSSGSDGEGIDLDWGTSHCIVQKNYTHDNVSGGLMAFQFSFGSGPSWHDNSYRFNISRGDGAGLQEGASGLTMTGCYFYKNIAVEGGGYPVNMAIGAGAGTSDCTYTGNSFYLRDASMSRFINDVKTTNEKFTGNEYYGNGVFVWRGTQYNTLALWRAASGQERTGGKWIRCSARRMRALLTAVPITDRALLIYSPVRHCAT